MEQKQFTKEDFERACILYTIRGRKKCPRCNSPIVEVMRDFGMYEEHCLRFSVEGIRCNYLKVLEFKKGGFGLIS